MPPPLGNSSSLDEINYENHDGQYQQDVDEPTQGVRSYQSQQPQDEQDHKNCPKYGFSPLRTHSIFSLRCPDTQDCRLITRISSLFLVLHAAIVGDIDHKCVCSVRDSCVYKGTVVGSLWLCFPESDQHIDHVEIGEGAFVAFLNFLDHDRLSPLKCTTITKKLTSSMTSGVGG